MPAHPSEAAHPGSLDVPALVPGAVSHRGVTYAERTGFRPLLMDVHVPASTPEPAPCVVWVHGGAWWEGDRRILPSVWPQGSLFAELVAAGLAVATVDYRLSGEATWPAPVEDVADAVRFVRDHAPALRVDPARIGIAGESAGGHLAAMIALTGTGPVAVQAAALLYAVTDLHDWAPEEALFPLADSPEALLMGSLPDADPAAWSAASPITHVHPGAPPTLLVTGDRDLVVPARQSERLHAALVDAGAPDVELELVPGADHCFGGVDPMPPLRRVVAFLADRLGA